MRAKSPKERLRRRPFARHAADGRARAERVADIEQTRGLADLEPKIAGETFVGSFACQHHLVALPAHFAGEREQRRARGVEHRAFRGADQGGIGVGDKTGPASTTVGRPPPMARAASTASFNSSKAGSVTRTVKLGNARPATRAAVAST